VLAHANLTSPRLDIADTFIALQQMLFRCAVNLIPQ
jgi:hypothetical protein